MSCAVPLLSAVPLLAMPSSQDSVETISSEEQKRRLIKSFNHVTQTYLKQKKSDVNARIVNAEFATFKLLLIIARSIDKPGTFGMEMNDLEEKFKAADKKNVSFAHKITNGFTSMYSMYSMLARMYTQMPGTDSLKHEIDEIESGVAAKLHAKVTAMEVVAAQAKASFRLLDLTLRQADTSGIFRQSLDNISNQFIEGEKVASTDEDHFLNSLFRTFELSQLWGFAADPLAKESINKLLNELVMGSQRAQAIDEQIALALESLYSVTHLIAEGYLKRIR